MTLGRSTGIGRIAVLVETALVADADGASVVASGMCTSHLLRPADVQLTVAGDVIVVAAAAESTGPVAGFELLHRKRTVTACGRTVNDNEFNLSHKFSFSLSFLPCKRPKVERPFPLIYPTHDDVVRVVNTEVSTVMMNWIIVFQVFKSFKIFILKQFSLSLSFSLKKGWSRYRRLRSWQCRWMLLSGQTVPVIVPVPVI